MHPDASIPLAQAGAALVHRLGGHWHHASGMCHCPAHDDRTPSLSVRVGSRALLFKCFAGCSNEDIFRSLRAQGIAVPREGAGGGGRPVFGGFAQAATRLWERAEPIGGTLAQRYLALRRIPDTTTTALRFHARTPLGPSRQVRFLPALIAAVRRGPELLAVQRIFLGPDGGLAQDLGTPRRSLGRPLDGAVILAGAGPRLGLAEGVESALSAAYLLDIPVWATLGADRFDQIALPAGLTQLFLLADNDGAGRRAASRALVRYARPGLQVDARWPPARFGDWNDFHQAEGERAKGWLRLAA